MRHYCTAFDHNYLVRGLALRASLDKHAQPYTLWVLCHDDVTHDSLTRLDLPDVRPISVRELEVWDPDLAQARDDRSRIEYYFTCSPVWPLYLLDHIPAVETVTYLDADLFFYSSPEAVFAELIQGSSILIVPHRFPLADQWKEQFGIYNVGFLAFRNDGTSRRCLKWWRERCLEWCYDRVEPGRFGDQKYLDEWPRLFPGVRVVHHPGAGLGPWNWMTADIRIDGARATIDGQPLVYYHFHGLTVFHRRLYDVGLTRERRMPRTLRKWLYDGYIDAMEEAASVLRRRGLGRTATATDRRHLRHTPLRVGKKLIRALGTRLR
jgi:hypothetical protein